MLCSLKSPLNSAGGGFGKACPTIPPGFYLQPFLSRYDCGPAASLSCCSCYTLAFGFSKQGFNLCWGLALVMVQYILHSPSDPKRKLGGH